MFLLLFSIEYKHIHIQKHTYLLTYYCPMNLSYLSAGFHVNAPKKENSGIFQPQTYFANFGSLKVHKIHFIFFYHQISFKMLLKVSDDMSS